VNKSGADANAPLVGPIDVQSSTLPFCTSGWGTTCAGVWVVEYLLVHGQRHASNIVEVTHHTAYRTIQDWFIRFFFVIRKYFFTYFIALPHIPVDGVAVLPWLCKQSSSYTCTAYFLVYTFYHMYSR
jgi:hypothetical protein